MHLTLEILRCIFFRTGGGGGGGGGVLLGEKFAKFVTWEFKRALAYSTYPYWDNMAFILQTIVSIVGKFYPNFTGICLEGLNQQ